MSEAEKESHKTKRKKLCSIQESHPKLIIVEIYDIKTDAVVLTKGLTPKEFAKFREEFSDRYIGMDWRMCMGGKVKKSE